MKILSNNLLHDYYCVESKLWEHKILKLKKNHFNDSDILIVFNKMIESKIITNALLVLIIYEPPSIRYYPKKYLQQFDIIISNFKISTHSPYNYIFPTCLEIDYTNLKINSRHDRICIFNTLKFKPMLVFMRSTLFLYLQKINLCDMFGKNTKNGIANKGVVLNNYKYTLVIENYKDNTYFSEKLPDAIKCEVLTFYYGCKSSKIFNENFIHPKSIIPIDINNFSKTISIIKDALINNEYEKRLKYIKLSKKNISSPDKDILSIIENITFERKDKQTRIIYNDKYFFIEKFFFKIYFFFILLPLKFPFILKHIVENYYYYIKVFIF